MLPKMQILLTIFLFNFLLLEGYYLKNEGNILQNDLLSVEQKNATDVWLEDSENQTLQGEYDVTLNRNISSNDSSTEVQQGVWKKIKNKIKTGGSGNGNNYRRPRFKNVSKSKGSSLTGMQTLYVVLGVIAATLLLTGIIYGVKMYISNK